MLNVISLRYASLSIVKGWTTANFVWNLVVALLWPSLWFILILPMVFEPWMYAISTNSDFLDEKFFEFDILDETFRFKLSNLKYKIPLGNYRHKTPLFFTILHCKTTPFLIIVLQSTNTSIWQAANCPENVYGPTEKCSSAFKFH